MFAADLKVFKVIKCRTDTVLLQSDMNSYNNCGISNDLKLNVSKYYYITFSRISDPIVNTI